ncbi:MAG: hypothetical protein ACXQTI_05185 [Candidatus Nezhaarchaeales archaeon]
MSMTLTLKENNYARRNGMMYGEVVTPHDIGKEATAPHPCSCCCRGNKRKTEGMSIQELRQIDV